MAKITKDMMTIRQVLERDTNTAPIFFEMGMHCIGCPSASGKLWKKPAWCMDWKWTCWWAS